MKPLETIGAIAIAGIVGLGIGAIAGSHHEAGKWQAAVASQQHRVDDLNAKLGAAESDNAKLAAQINQTADQLEDAREARVTSQPVPAACTDTPTDLGELRKLIEPR